MGFEEWLPLLMFAALLALIMLGFPVAFTLSGTALLFAGIGYAMDIFMLPDLGFIPSRVWGIISNFTLVAVPLFVFMGLMMEKSGLAEELLKTTSYQLRKIKGNLAYTVIVVGAILAASTGIVGATVVTMGVLALPAMLQAGYNKSLATGTIAAAGTLGQIIPPSVVLVLLGDIMSVDVGDLFIGAIFPGALLVALYASYVFFAGKWRKSWIPSNAAEPATTVSTSEILMTLLPPLALMIIVLGSILVGFASPTEAAACGAAGTLVITGLRKRFAWSILRDVMRETAVITTMVFTILIGAQFFSVVFRGLYGDDVISDLVTQSGLDRHYILFAIMALMFVLGFFLDFLEICFIVIPIVQPIFVSLGYDQLWLAVLIAMNLQTSFLTPPFGFALFYLKGVAPPEVTTGDIYRGVVPFVLIQVLALFALTLFPAIVVWLPKALG